MQEVKSVKCIEKYKRPVIKSVSHGEVIYSMGNIVSNIVLTL